MKSANAASREKDKDNPKYFRGDDLPTTTTTQAALAPTN